MHLFFLKKNLFFIEIPYLLLLLFPFSLITGPFIPDLIVTLLALIFITYCFTYKDYSYFNNIFFKLFVLFVLFLWIITIFNIENYEVYENYYNLKTPLFYFRFGFFSLAIWFLIERKKSIFLHLYWCFFIIFSVLVFDGFFQFFFDKNLSGLPKISNRVSSFFGDELILGSFLSRMFFIFLSLTIFLNEKKKIYFAFFILVLIEILIYLSGERSAFVLLNLATFFFICLAKNFRKLQILVFSISLIFILIISQFNQSINKRMVEETLFNLGFNGSEKIYIFSKLHETYFETSLKMFKHNPFSGVGIRNYRNFCSDIKYQVSDLSCSTHPHNTYMELLAETGVIGFSFIFLIFLILIYYSFKHFLLKFKGKFIFNDVQIALLSSVLINLWPLIPTGSFFNNWLNCLYYFPLGILLWSLLNKKIYINLKV